MGDASECNIATFVPKRGSSFRPSTCLKHQKVDARLQLKRCRGCALLPPTINRVVLQCITRGDNSNELRRKIWAAMAALGCKRVRPPTRPEPAGVADRLTQAVYEGKPGLSARTPCRPCERPSSLLVNVGPRTPPRASSQALWNRRTCIVNTVFDHLCE